MRAEANPLHTLVHQLSKLPGIGEKTAMRLGYFLLKNETGIAETLANALLQAKEKIHFCSICFYYATEEHCEFCTDTKRNSITLCVVEKPSDVAALERAHVHPGRYHVLHGVLSPLDGIGPEQLKIRELLERSPGTNEILLALNSSVEAEATVHYIHRLFKPLGIRVTRLAYGLPAGGVLEFTDRETLGKAFEHRLEMQ